MPAPYYKLNKGLFLGFLFKPLGGLCPPRGLNKKASENNPLSITYSIFNNPLSITYSIFNVQSMALKIACSNPRFTLVFVRKC